MVGENNRWTLVVDGPAIIRTAGIPDLSHVRVRVRHGARSMAEVSLWMTEED